MTNEIKILIEQYGLFAVVDYISGYCGQQSEIRNEQAVDWAKAELALDEAATKILDLFK